MTVSNSIQIEWLFMLRPVIALKADSKLEDWLQIRKIPSRLPEIAAVDSNRHDWDWKNRILKKKDFCTKTFFKSDLFWWHFVVEHTSGS